MIAGFPSYREISTLQPRRPPVRVVHARGAGAHGMVDVTDVAQLRQVEHFKKADHECGRRIARGVGLSFLGNHVVE
ncbi:catalase [Ferroacidibacillus organovorans]|uniref:catalase n=1 Tax=Ferroacidibacillus organovorans TaxID=1765683 RepID=UPI000AC375D7|nr:catalase [Ferroacidibacillus organovorans]